MRELEISNERLIELFKRGSKTINTTKHITILLITLKKFHSPKNSNKMAIVKNTSKISLCELVKIFATELREL